jgi:hypothetical protein
LRAELAGGDLRVLRFDRRGDIAWHQPEAHEFRRIEPDAHGVLRAEHVHVADARQASDRILQVRDQVVRHVAAACRVGLVVDRQHQQEVRVGFRHHQAL